MLEIEHIKLSELSKKIREVIKNAFDNKFYWVVAEISGHKFYVENDRHYCELVEKIEEKNTEAAKIKCTVWPEGSKNITAFEKKTGQKFTDGLQVLVKLRVEYHIIFGLSVVLTEIDPSFTLGNLEKQRLLTLARLLKENSDKIVLENEEYITFNKLLPLNNVLQKIALVASANSEGFYDFIGNITKNKFGYKFNIDHYFSSVQGAAAEEELKNKMVHIFESGKNYDCVVIIRGGGSKTDFLAFDTYGIARAVARFPIPVITGIGHLRDVSITDLMAHTNTNAPTKAAEFIVAHNRAFEENLNQIKKSLIIKIQQVLAYSQNKIFSFNSSILNKARNILTEKKDTLNKTKQIVINNSKNILFQNHKYLLNSTTQITAKPITTVSKKQNDLKNIANNLKSFSKINISNQQGYLNHFLSVFRIMSPKNILKKGFAIVKQNGKILKNGEQIEVGTELNITLAETELKTKVISKNKINEREYEL